MNKLYLWIDRLWQAVAETVFVRFEFDLPTAELRHRLENGHLVFALVNGGLVDWLLLSSWCRSQGLGPVQTANRKRILLLSHPIYFFRVLFGRASYADLFTEKNPFPRLICLQGKERKKIHVPTPTETLLSEVYARISAAGELSRVSLVPVLITWRRHTRGGSRQVSEYLLGLSSHPNLLGKLWYLLRRRTDSSVRALGFLPLAPKESLEKLEGFDENESMRAAKSVRRRILVAVQQEIRVSLGPRYHSPSLIKETVLRDPSIQTLITQLAEEQGVDRQILQSRAYQNLTQIVSDYRFRFIEVMFVFLSWLFSKVFDGIHSKEAQWQQVREIVKSKPVAFIPCHRSHLDYLVIPYLLFVHDMVTPHIAAGLNLSFWPLGKFLRMGGAFFIRRSFRGDVLYQAVLTKYVQTLLQHRYNVKFFIEGTRSRSGKMLAPAYGMLKMVVETQAQHVCEDIALIPVSICYDEVPEQGAYSREIGGGQKVKENAWELIRSGQIIRRRFGKVYVRVAPPISVRDNYRADPTDSRLLLQKTAFQVCKSICDVTPITPKSVLCSVLLCHRNPILTLEEILRLSGMLSRYVEEVGMELSTPNRESLRRAVEQIVRRLRKTGVVLEIENVPRKYVCEARKRGLLNFYKNNSIHCFVIPSIAMHAYTLAWRDLADPSDGKTVLEVFQNHALALRDVLKFEFFFNPRATFLEELDRSARFLFGDVIEKTLPIEFWSEALKQRFPISSDLSVFTRIIGELLESYLLFSEFVLYSTDSRWEKKTLLAKALKYAEARHQQGDLIFPESLSMVNYTNALLYLENQGLLKAETESGWVVKTDKDIQRTVNQLADYRDLLQEKEPVSTRL